APELAELRALPGLQIHVAASDTITTFGHEHVATRRQLSLLERARSLAWTDVPEAWRQPEVLYAGPVAGECDESLVERFPGAHGVAGIQGWLRDPGLRRRVRPRRLGSECALPPMLRAVGFAASDHPAASAITRSLTAAG